MIHTSIEHYRKKSRYFLVDVNEAKEVEVLPDALGRLSRQEVLNLIQQLPAGYRTIFNLYEVEGFSHQEISVMMNVSVGTSKSQLSRAKSWLKERIEHQNQAGNFSENHASNGDQ
jgi:RNA polymerase sigma-70 factor (ECF subfamily)